jgi:hypothetical protein
LFCGHNNVLLGILLPQLYKEIKAKSMDFGVFVEEFIKNVVRDILKEVSP